MGKNNTKAEKAKRNQEYAQKFKKKRTSGSRSGRPFSKPSFGAGQGTGVSGSAPAGERTMHAAVCAACGTQTTVPFEPTSGKPVLCRPCFSAQKA